MTEMTHLTFFVISWQLNGCEKRNELIILKITKFDFLGEKMNNIVLFRKKNGGGGGRGDFAV